ncbi:MAG: hypothetical protein N2C14_24035, partial [Planctomycetales bacterium]
GFLSLGNVAGIPWRSVKTVRREKRRGTVVPPSVAAECASGLADASGDVSSARFFKRGSASVIRRAINAARAIGANLGLFRESPEMQAPGDR